MYLIELFFLAYFFYVVLYSLFFAIGGFLYKGQKRILDERSNLRYLILVPGYKEDSIIVDSARKNLEVDYDSSKFDLVIIADSFQAETLESLGKLPLKVHEVSFEKSTKVKSIKNALENLNDPYDYVIILDADNVMEKDYLQRVDSFIQETKSVALQTQRAPKNKNNELAILDGISESINHHLYRKGSFALGFHSSLNGSGMVFNLKLFTEIIFEMDSVGGFDRELEFRLLEKKSSIQYLEQAIVYDEKVDEGKNFENQRKRWISSQYTYLARYLKKGVIALLKGNFVYFNNTVLRNIQLPRSINLGLLTVITVLIALFGNPNSTQYWTWISLWLLNALVIFICIPKSYFNRKLLKSLLLLPKLFLKMFLLLFKLKGANKKFIHTPHKPSN